MTIEKRLIATRADENHKEISEITHPLLKRYAEKCGADFLVISDNYKDFHHHYRILKFYELFEEYDRILSLDTDVLIMNRCPNIFDTVPEGMIGSIYEDVGTRQEDRRMRLKAVQRKFGDVGIVSGYINTGVAIFPKESREIFNLEKKDVWEGLGYDDVQLRYEIAKKHLNIFELSIRYNFMSLFSEAFFGFNNRVNAFIIHYAGQGFMLLVPRIEQIKQDYILLKRYGML